MIIIIESSYPLQSSKESAQVFMEHPPLPDFIKEKGLYFKMTDGVGIRALHILECEDAKYSEAAQHIGKRIMRYSKVSGFTSSVEPWTPVEEALKMLE